MITLTEIHVKNKRFIRKGTLGINECFVCSVSNEMANMGDSESPYTQVVLSNDANRTSFMVLESVEDVIKLINESKVKKSD